MKALYPHRWWLALLVFAIAVMAGSGPLLHLARVKAAHNLAEAQTERVQAEQNLRQLRADVAAARALNRQIDRAQAEQVLAASDRLKAATMLESEASQARLSHFSYTLSPEAHVSLSAGGEMQDLATSTIALAADAAEDQSVYAFIERVRRGLPGRVRITQMTITRSNEYGRPLAALNVHFEANLEWLSNGAVQTVAGGP